MDLIRNRKPPNTVHRPGCIYRGEDCEPWAYAANSTEEEIREAAEMFPWIRLCGRCFR